LKPKAPVFVTLQIFPYNAALVCSISAKLPNIKVILSTCRVLAGIWHV